MLFLKRRIFYIEYLFVKYLSIIIVFFLHLETFILNDLFIIFMLLQCASLT